MTNYPIYLDYNSTTPVDPRVLEAMLPYFTHWYGNAASATHAYGWVAEKAVEGVRETLAQSLGCNKQEIVFTSGATESINLAIKGVAEAYKQKGRHIITLATEHKAVLDVCETLSRQGFEITLLPVDAQGNINPVDLEKAIRNDTLLVCAMYANNETGVLLPMPEISRIVHDKGCLLFCDATQAFGKIPCRADELGADLLALSAHKLYGPKGIGALYVRRKNPRVRLTPLIDGGGQEGGRRSGTLNVTGIVGLGKATELAMDMQTTENTRLGILRDTLEKTLYQYPQVSVNAAAALRLSHVANICFRGLRAETFIEKAATLAVATGSACTSAEKTPSHVLLAMGMSEEDARCSIRFSLGRFTTAEEIQTTLRIITAMLV